MYAQGQPELTLASDGWTYTTKDGSLTGMFEDTIYISKKGPITLT